MNRSEHTEANSQSGREDAPSGWQSIETAPKDGQSIIAFVPGFGMGAMVLFWMDGRWREPAQMLGLKSEPSHWMALPAAPDGGAGVPVHAPAETATGSDQNLILSLTKEVEGLREAVKPLADAAEAYIRTHGNFRVRGETEAERRFSKGEQDETAMEAAFDVLHELSFDDLYRALSTSGRAEP